MELTHTELRYIAMGQYVYSNKQCFDRNKAEAFVEGFMSAVNFKDSMNRKAKVTELKVVNSVKQGGVSGGGYERD